MQRHVAFVCMRRLYALCLQGGVCGGGGEGPMYKVACVGGQSRGGARGTARAAQHGEEALAASSPLTSAVATPPSHYAAQHSCMPPHTHAHMHAV